MLRVKSGGTGSCGGPVRLTVELRRAWEDRRWPAVDRTLCACHPQAISTSACPLSSEQGVFRDMVPHAVAVPTDQRQREWWREASLSSPLGLFIDSPML